MPRNVDPAEREAEITTAALQLLATNGPRALTLRSLATELGGSSTLVTHFYPNRGELLKAITGHLIRQYEGEIAELDKITDPIRGLRAVMEWLLPISPAEQGLERRRVLMSAEADADPHLRRYFSVMENKERAALSRHLVELVPNGEIERHLDVLRSFTNGIVLSAAEHPDNWPVERQVAALELLMDSLGLNSRAG
jgi:AcrR family transcriptional regulator